MIAKTITLIDTRSEVPGETLGTVISAHFSMAAAFRANEQWQKAMAKKIDGPTDTVTKIVTLKNRLKNGDTVRTEDVWRNP